MYKEARLGRERRAKRGGRGGRWEDGAGEGGGRRVDEAGEGARREDGAGDGGRNEEGAGEGGGRCDEGAGEGGAQREEGTGEAVRAGESAGMGECMRMWAEGSEALSCALICRRTTGWSALRGVSVTVGVARGVGVDSAQSDASVASPRCSVWL